MTINEITGALIGAPLKVHQKLGLFESAHLSAFSATSAVNNS